MMFFYIRYARLSFGGASLGTCYVCVHRCCRYYYEYCYGIHADITKKWAYMHRTQNLLMINTSETHAFRRGRLYCWATEEGDTGGRFLGVRAGQRVIDRRRKRKPSPPIIDAMLADCRGESINPRVARAVQEVGGGDGGEGIHLSPAIRCSGGVMLR